MFAPCSTDTAPVALTTDHYVSLAIHVDNAQDGDVWTWALDTPTGPFIGSASMEFHDSLDSYEDCWVIRLGFFRQYIICGGNSISEEVGGLVLDGPPGLWHINLSYNGQTLWSKPFQLVKPPVLRFGSFSEAQLASGLLNAAVELEVSPQDPGPWKTHIRVGTSPEHLSEGIDVDLEEGAQDLGIGLAAHGIERFDDDVILTIETTTTGGCASIPPTIDSTTLAIPLPVVFIHGYLPPSWFLRTMNDIIGKTDGQRSALFRFLSAATQPGGGFTTSDHRIPYKEGGPYQTLWFPEWTDIFDAHPNVVAGRIRNAVYDALSQQNVYATRVNLVTHSAGGLVARYDITRGAPVRKLIMVGCPNHGTSRTYYQTGAFRRSEVETLRQGVGGFLIPRDRVDGCSKTPHQQLYLKASPCARIVDPPAFESTFIPFDVPPPADVQVTNIFAARCDRHLKLLAKTPWDLIAWPKTFRDNPADNWYDFDVRNIAAARRCCPATDWEAMRRGDDWVAVADAELFYPSVANILVVTRSAHLDLVANPTILQQIAMALGLVDQPDAAMAQCTLQTIYDYAGLSDSTSYGLTVGSIDSVLPGPGVLRIGDLTNSPNPFARSTTISVDIGTGSSGAVIQVFDVAGHLVRKIPLESAYGGRRQVTWDGTGDDGRQLPGGVYYYRVVSDSGSPAPRRAILVR
jgi:hypothetical protein